MRKTLSYLFLVAIVTLLSGVSLSAQLAPAKLSRSVVGSGGVLAQPNPSGVKMSGISGQLAIEKISGTMNGNTVTDYQGFWVPQFNTTAVVEPVAQKSGLSNYPNPFNSSTTINYELPGSCQFSIKIYDVVGNVVKTLISAYQDAGPHQIVWDGKDESGRDVGSGSYIYELVVSPADVAGMPAFQSYNTRNIMVIVR